MTTHTVALVYIEVFELGLGFEYPWGKRFPNIFILKATTVGNETRVCINVQVGAIC